MYISSRHEQQILANCDYDISNVIVENKLALLKNFLVSQFSNTLPGC